MFKLMLCYKVVVSEIKDFIEIKFCLVLEEFIYEDGIGDCNKVSWILLISGKLYYELVVCKVKDNCNDFVIVWFE